MTSIYYTIVLADQETGHKKQKLKEKLTTAQRILARIVLSTFLKTGHENVQLNPDSSKSDVHHRKNMKSLTLCHGRTFCKKTR